MASSNLTYYIPEPWNQWDLLKFCPGEYFNSSNVKNASSSLCEAGRLKLDFYNAPAWVNLASALIALVGCVLILFTYHSYASFRTGSRKVATCLAFSNMFLALGSILGSLNYLVYRYQDSNVNNETASCTAFAIICQVQAFITWTSALASFIWTVILALYLYLALARGSSAFFNYKYCWWSYYALSFAVPMFIIGPIEGSGFLGYSPYGNGGGCFITTGYVNMSNESNESSVLYAYTDASTGLVSFVKGLEVFAYVLVIMLFSIILCKSKRSLASSSEAQNNNESPQPVLQLPHSCSWDWKVFAVPFVFVSLRIWGTIVLFLTIILNYTKAIDDNGCVSQPVYWILFALTILQAMGDPGQGWGNMILFVFLSPKVREHMFFSCCKRCRHRIRSRMSVESHLTSPVDESDERDPAGFSTSYRLHPTTSSSFSTSNLVVELPSSGSYQSDSPGSTPAIQSSSGVRRTRSQL